jgi:amino acid adenylation domain-containing protein
MPTDYPRPVVQNFAGKKIRFELKKEILFALRNLALKNEATVFMALLTVYNALLSRYSCQEDIVIGTISAGRQLREIQNMVGVFINPIALRNYPRKDKTYSEFLAEIKTNTLDAFKNQLYPFGELLEKLLKKKDFSRNPLFDTMIVFQNIDIGNRGIERLHFDLDSPRDSDDETNTQQDICLWVEEEDGRMLIDLEYCSALFKRETMERFIKHFLTFLEKAAQNPGLKLGEIDIIDQYEKQQIVEQFNNTDTPFPIVHALHYLFEQQVERIPDHAAVVAMVPVLSISNREGGSITVTYKELNKIANGLAALLIKKGVNADVLVGILFERKVELISAVIGVLKAGGACLPLDINAPGIRIAQILADSRSSVLLSDHNLIENKLIEKWTGEIISSKEFLNSSSPLNLLSSCVLNPANLAYVIYTSGSTGIPKGVMIEHDNIVNAAFAWLKEYKLTEMEVTLLQVANFSFDVFMGDFARTFSAGGKMIICPEETRIDPHAFYTMIIKHQVTLFETTPSLAIPVMEYVNKEKLEIGHLQLLIIGSDNVRVEDFKTLLSHFGNRLRIINSYGATEATVDSSYYEERIENFALPGNVPIGKPMPNMKFFILDAYGAYSAVQPVGIPGELYISGKGVGRGYLNNPELTADRFRPLITLMPQMSLMKNKNSALRANFHHSSFIIQHSILYSTGDLARWLPDGNIEFVGRIDYQVKIRGFRIELGEIETELLKYNLVKEAAVIDWEDEAGEKYLCGYIVMVEKFELALLKEFLSGRLPNYMIPSFFVGIEDIPLNPNGKVDRKALPEPLITIGEDYTAPGNEIEEKVAAIWAEVLEIEKSKLSVNTNFFDLGGHSLKATVLIAKIQKAFNLKLALVEIFKYPTIRGIAQLIEVMDWVNTTNADTGIDATDIII